MSNGYSRETFIHADEKTVRGITFDMLSEALDSLKCMKQQHQDHIIDCRKDLEIRTEKYREKFDQLNKLAVRCQEGKKRNWLQRSVWFMAGVISGITGKIMSGFTGFGGD